jgi:DNA primase
MSHPNQVQARLQWEAACERLSFALDPPPGVPPGEAPEVAAALRLVQAALEELGRAFSPRTASSN